MTYTVAKARAASRNIKHHFDGGLFFATCEDEPTLFVSAPDKETLYCGVEAALAKIFEQSHREDFVVMRTQTQDEDHLLMVVVPTLAISESHLHTD